jgi:ammonia channel protein AmtB
VNFLGQAGGAVVLALLGFIPGYLISLLLKKLGVLRVPAHAEERGLDLTEVPAKAYPEWALTGASITVTSAPVASEVAVGAAKPA